MFRIKNKKMVNVLSHHIISPLGAGSETNYEAVKAGRSALRRYEQKWGLPEPFTASLFEEGEEPQIPGMTRYESLCIASIQGALDKLPKEQRRQVLEGQTLLLLSTTKANVELLAEGISDEREYPVTAARRINDYFHFSVDPVVVCNACISGVSALLTARMLLLSGYADHAIVCGADSQSKFIVSGFQSFRALSEEECRPFDAERTGLNLGEAGATMILSRELEADWHLIQGAVCNDANHISGPSRTGEGSYRALQRTLAGIDPAQLAFINVHGTATLYNDEMESIALTRAGLTATPINALKGYYGHTMGAAGVMETILSMMAVDDHTVLATRGFHAKGVSGDIHINAENQPTDKRCFVKLLSGFGGCNAAVLMAKGDDMQVVTSGHIDYLEPDLTHSVSVSPYDVSVDGSSDSYPVTTNGASLITELYKKYIGDYPKFYKMDMLCRLGFVASELLHRQLSKPLDENTSVVLFNRSSSYTADVAHQASIADPDNFFPSPSVFVYTLPNILTGEVAIRHKYYGETTFYVAWISKDFKERLAQLTLEANGADAVIFGDVEYIDEDNFSANLHVMERYKGDS